MTKGDVEFYAGGLIAVAFVAGMIWLMGGGWIGMGILAIVMAIILGLAG